jgi:retinol dehydrogenase 12
MKGKTVVVTGGTSGIGEVAVEKLAEMGARIVLVARDRSRGEGTLVRLREKAPGLTHTVHYADLTRISEMKRVAAEVAEAEPRIDVLVNNAGAMFSTRRRITARALPRGGNPENSRQLRRSDIRDAMATESDIYPW